LSVMRSVNRQELEALQWMALVPAVEGRLVH
jgi:hypothetical protein